MWTLPLVGEDIKQNQRRQWHSVTLPREHSAVKGRGSRCLLVLRGFRDRNRGAAVSFTVLGVIPPSGSAAAPFRFNKWMLIGCILTDGPNRTPGANKTWPNIPTKILSTLRT